MEGNCPISCSFIIDMRDVIGSPGLSQNTAINCQIAETFKGTALLPQYRVAATYMTAVMLDDLPE